MSAAKVRNIGGAVTVVGVLVFLGAHLLNYLGAQSASGDTGPDIGAGVLMMLGEFIIALGVAVAVVYGMVAAMRERAWHTGIPVALVGVLLAVEGAVLALREYDVAGHAAVVVGLAVLGVGLVVAAVSGVSGKGGASRSVAPRA